jgi:N-acyl homoserine lactone hydrolase
MSYTIRPLLLGKMKNNKSNMTYLMNFDKEMWTAVACWFVRTEEKNILIDSGAPPEVMKKHWYLPYEEIMPFEEALHSVGMTPDSIDMVIQTHLHFDHCGNTPKCRNAEIIVQCSELAFALEPHPLFYGTYPTAMLKDLRYREVEGDLDVVPGIRVLHVPGHSPGCQAVSIETEKGLAVISGFCAIRANFSPPEKVKRVWPVLTPGVHTNSLEAFNSAKRIEEIADIVVAIHDMDDASQAHIP